MPRIWPKFRSGIYLIMHVCLSISAQLCCRIKLLSFWVLLNAIPAFLMITDLSWPSILQYIITNHASGQVVVFRNFFKTNFIETIKESWRYILLSLLPSELMWHCVQLIWPYTVFSMIIRMKYFTGIHFSF